MIGAGFQRLPRSLDPNVASRVAIQDRRSDPVVLESSCSRSAAPQCLSKTTRGGPSSVLLVLVGW
jgi:hypothetical protein